MANEFTAICSVPLAALLMALYFYPLMPSVMAVHWGISGYADGFSGKGFGTFFFPALIAVFSSLLFLLPHLFRLPKIQGSAPYEGIIFVFSLFLLYVYALTISWNLLPSHFFFPQLLAPGLAVLFWFLASISEKIPMNPIIGIRTPWTFSSAAVWEKTHKLAGKLFKACAVLALVGMALPQYSLILDIAPMLVLAVVLIAYSFVKSRERLAFNCLSLKMSICVRCAKNQKARLYYSQDQGCKATYWKKANRRSWTWISLMRHGKATCRK